MESLRAQGDIVQIYFGHLPVYAVNTPELVHHMLVDQAAHFEQGRLAKKAQALLGESLVTIDGPLHHRQRRLMQPAFHRERINRYANTMIELAAARAASWRPGQRLAVLDEMLALAMGMVTRTLLSADADDAGVAELLPLMENFLKGLAMHTLLPADLLEKLPMSGSRRFRADSARLRQLIGRIIEAYRADGSDRGDLLSMLLLARDQQTGERMTDRQVQDEITEITLAAYEPTGATLAWCFHELGQHPHVERRVHMEVDALLNGRPATYSDFTALEYTRRVVNETLRLHPPFWLVMKRSIADVTLGRFRVPAGTEMVFSPYALHRDANVYPDPLTFDPDRWLPDRARELPRHAFMPFGAARHMCIGESFAWMAMTLATATIAARWRLQPVLGPPVRERAHILVYPKRLVMTATPRHP